jgi:hypothetical protein
MDANERAGCDKPSQMIGFALLQRNHAVIALQ